MLGHADRTWRTHELAAPDQFAAWGWMVAEAFAPVTLSRALGTAEDEGFLTSCAGRRVGDLAVSWLSSQAQRVEHTAWHVARGSNDVYFLNLPLDGEGCARQDGRTSVTGAGDFVLVHGDRPFTLDFEDRFEQLSLAIPRDLLDPLLADPDRANCVVVKGDSGAGAIASAALRSLAAQRGDLTPREARGITEHVVGLLALAVSSTLEEGPTSLRSKRYQYVLDELERRLTDPELSPAGVAHELSISASYLTKLFAEHGTSFGREVMTRRLNRAHHLLTALPGAGGASAAGAPVGGPGAGGAGIRTVTEVALACGFHDSAYFSRAFRARFGHTPSEHRAAAARVS